MLSLNPKDPDGGLILAPCKAGDKNQRWCGVLGKATKNDTFPLTLVNVGSGKAVGIRKPGRGVRTTMLHRSIGTYTQLEIIGSLKGDGVVIRLLNDPNLNLNVFGSGPYRDGSAVGVWDWGRGAKNETRQIVKE